MAYWLMKSEPDTYSIDDLIKQGKGMWEGCRNYTVRNFFRDKFKVGDEALFYHSNSEPVGIVGIMKVVKESYPDPTQFEPTSDYFDPKSTEEEPRWLVVDVAFVEKFSRVVTLKELKEHPLLKDMAVCMRGQRLSVMPVEPEHWTEVLKLAKG